MNYKLYTLLFFILMILLTGILSIQVFVTGRCVLGFVNMGCCVYWCCELYRYTKIARKDKDNE